MKKEMTLREFARSGGLATLKKHGKEHFKQMAITREAKKRLEKQRKIIQLEKSKI